MTPPHAARLKALRTLMKKKGLAAVVVPRQDEFQGEYVAPYAERLQWLTGFKGSWGVAIVAARKAAIFVDGRYTVQVRQQTDTALFEPHHLIDDPPASWIAKVLKRGEKLGFDPWVTTIAEARKLRAAAETAGARLVALQRHPVDMVWKDQPPRPEGSITAQAIEHAGATAAEKQKAIAATLEKLGAQAAFIADPASVCWALNIRGSDVPYTPLPLAYALLRRTGKAELYADGRRLTEEAKAALKGVAVCAPLADLPKRLAALKGKSVALDPGIAPEDVRLSLEKAGARVIEAPDPCTLPKARKNATEQQGARAAQSRDGAAVSRFLRWLAEHGSTGQTEATAAEKLLEMRETSNLLRGLSFETISASGPNAASPHYHLTPETARPLKDGEIYLIDSGGQYLDGTTDITRTVIIGQPTEDMRDRFTRVLKGMIGLSVLRFPKGTTGGHVDAIARAALWKAGLDFDHGTGHGVGSYLSVHEGPARISKAGTAPLEPGMILSNEPGYYKPDAYGIRIENLLLVTEASDIAGGERPMLGFETLTLAPIDRTLIDTRLLTREELQWLDSYHARVLTELAPLVDAETKSWLQEACAPLT